MPINPAGKVEIGRNTVIKLLKSNFLLMGPEAVFDGLNRITMQVEIWKYIRISFDTVWVDLI